MRVLTINKRRLSFPILLVSIAGIAACQTAKTINNTSASPLDGIWTLAAYDCESGKLTQEAKAINNDLSTGGTHLVATITGEVSSELFDNGKCKYLIKELWKVEGSRLRITNTSAQLAEKHSSQSSVCLEYINHSERIHDYLITGRLLKITLQKNYHASVGASKDQPISGNLCDKGREILVFTRKMENE